MPLGDSTATYPSCCTNHPTPGSGDWSQPLLRHDTSNQESLRPIKPFVYHCFHNCLASLLLMKDLEEALDEACDWLRDVVEESLPNFVSDMWGMEFLRSFKGPTPCTFIIDSVSKGCYVFALNIDFFNVKGIHIHGCTTPKATHGQKSSGPRLGLRTHQMGVLYMLFNTLLLLIAISIWRNLSVWLTTHKSNLQPLKHFSNLGMI